MDTLKNLQARSFQPVPGLPLFVRAYRTADEIAWGETRRPTWDFTVSADGKPHSVLSYRSRFYNSDTPAAWAARNLDASLAASILYCVLSDAQAYETARDFKDFCWELGYSDDSSEAEKAWKECRRASETLHEVATDEVLRQAYETLSASN